ncbi:hypothetical protein PCE1_001348 [Barthelona sp. PCE]
MYLNNLLGPDVGATNRFNQLLCAQCEESHFCVAFQHDLTSTLLLFFNAAIEEGPIQTCVIKNWLVSKMVSIVVDGTPMIAFFGSSDEIRIYTMDNGLMLKSFKIENCLDFCFVEDFFVVLSSHTLRVYKAFDFEKPRRMPLHKYFYESIQALGHHMDYGVCLLQGSQITDDGQIPSTRVLFLGDNENTNFFDIGNPFVFVNEMYCSRINDRNEYVFSMMDFENQILDEFDLHQGLDCVLGIDGEPILIVSDEFPLLDVKDNIAAYKVINNNVACLLHVDLKEKCVFFYSQFSRTKYGMYETRVSVDVVESSLVNDLQKLDDSLEMPNISVPLVTEYQSTYSVVKELGVIPRLHQNFDGNLLFSRYQQDNKYVKECCRGVLMNIISERDILRFSVKLDILEDIDSIFSVVLPVPVSNRESHFFTYCIFPFAFFDLNSFVSSEFTLPNTKDYVNMSYLFVVSYSNALIVLQLYNSVFSVKRVLDFNGTILRAQLKFPSLFLVSETTRRIFSFDLISFNLTPLPELLPVRQKKPDVNPLFIFETRYNYVLDLFSVLDILCSIFQSSFIKDMKEFANIYMTTSSLSKFIIEDYMDGNQDSFPDVEVSISKTLQHDDIILLFRRIVIPLMIPSFPLVDECFKLLFSEDLPSKRMIKKLFLSYYKPQSTGYANFEQFFLLCCVIVIVGRYNIQINVDVLVIFAEFLFSITPMILRHLPFVLWFSDDFRNKTARKHVSKRTETRVIASKAVLRMFDLLHDYFVNHIELGNDLYDLLTIEEYFSDVIDLLFTEFTIEIERKQFEITYRENIMVLLHLLQSNDRSSTVLFGTPRQQMKLFNESYVFFFSNVIKFKMKLLNFFNYFLTTKSNLQNFDDLKFIEYLWGLVLSHSSSFFYEYKPQLKQQIIDIFSNFCFKSLESLFLRFKTDHSLSHRIIIIDVLHMLIREDLPVFCSNLEVLLVTVLNILTLSFGKFATEFIHNRSINLLVDIKRRYLCDFTFSGQSVCCIKQSSLDDHIYYSGNSKTELIYYDLKTFDRVNCDLKSSLNEIDAFFDGIAISLCGQYIAMKEQDFNDDEAGPIHIFRLKKHFIGRSLEFITTVCPSTSQIPDIVVNAETKLRSMTSPILTPPLASSIHKVATSTRLNHNIDIVSSSVDLLIEDSPLRIQKLIDKRAVCVTCKGLLLEVKI